MLQSGGWVSGLGTYSVPYQKSGTKAYMYVALKPNSLENVTHHVHIYNNSGTVLYMSTCKNAKRHQWQILAHGSCQMHSKHRHRQRRLVSHHTLIRMHVSVVSCAL